MAAESTTHVGTSAPSLRLPFDTSASTMMPIVFCASFVPWESENKLPETSCPSRNPRVTGPGWRRPTMR